MRQTIDFGGRSLSYVDAGHGQPLVLIHAFPLDAEMWQPQVDAVPSGWRLIAPDLRGFGGSSAADAQPARTMDDYADDVLALLERLGLDQAVIGGLSMGGYLAFALFRRAPRFFRALVLADTRPQPDNETQRAGRREMQSLADREGAAGVAKKMLPKLLAERTRRERPEVGERVRLMIESSSPSAIRAALDCLMSRPDSTPQLEAIRCPTLIIVGDQDELTPVADSEAMHRRIAGAELAVLPGAGHLSNLEQPEEFNAALSRFLRQAL